METRERTAHAPTQVFGLALLTAAAFAATVVGLLFTEGEKQNGDLGLLA